MNKSEFDLVIFDFDGTLANTFPWFLNLSDQVADRFHLKRIDRSQLESLRKMDSTRIAKHLGVPFWKMPLIGRHFTRLLNQHIDQVELFDGIAPLIHEIHEMGKMIAVVSSNAIENIKTALGPEIVNRVHYFEGGVRLKGKSAKFNNIVRTSGVSHKRVLSVGDEIRDILAARKANISCAAVTWGFAAPETLRAYEPDLLFDTVAEMRRTLTNTA